MIYIAADHIGLQLKQAVINYLLSNNYEVKDLGTDSRDRVNYTDFAQAVSNNVLKDVSSRGILICGTGIGMSMMANRYKGIRAAVCSNEYLAEMARRHNDANILCMGARLTDEELAVAIIKKFLSTPFEYGRHTKRVHQLDDRP